MSLSESSHGELQGKKQKLRELEARLAQREENDLIKKRYKAAKARELARERAKVDILSDSNVTMRRIGKGLGIATVITVLSFYALMDLRNNRHNVEWNKPDFRAELGLKPQQKERKKPQQKEKKKEKKEGKREGSEKREDTQLPTTQAVRTTQAVSSPRHLDADQTTVDANVSARGSLVSTLGRVTGMSPAAISAPANNSVATTGTTTPPSTSPRIAVPVNTTNTATTTTTTTTTTTAATSATMLSRRKEHRLRFGPLRDLGR